MRLTSRGIAGTVRASKITPNNNFFTSASGPKNLTLYLDQRGNSAYNKIHFLAHAFKVMSTNTLEPESVATRAKEAAAIRRRLY